MPRFLYYIVFLLILVPCFVSAQSNLIFSHLTVDDGLSESAVFSIAQDKQGFMWFGTKNGLNKYDGNTFEIYRTQNPGLDYILALQTDLQGRLWIGSKAGLRYYDPNTNQFSFISNTLANCIYTDAGGQLWIGTNKGLNRIKPDQVTKIDHFANSKNVLNSAEVFTIHQDQHKNLWLGTTLGLVKVTEPDGAFKLDIYPVYDLDGKTSVAEQISSIVPDSQQRLWVATKNNGILLFDPSTKRFNRPFLAERGKRLHDNIRKIKKDKFGNLWVATLKGLTHIDPEKEIIKTYKNNPEDPKSLNQNSIYDLFIDRQNSLWIGTYYGGVNVVYSRTTPFQIYQTKSTRNSLSSNVISSILEDGQHVWIGTEAEGLNYLNRKTGQSIRFKHNPNDPASLSSDLITAIYKDRKGRIWIGMVGGGLNLLNPDFKSFTHFKYTPGQKNGLTSNNVIGIVENNKEQLWLGTKGGGLNLFDPETKVFSQYTDKNKENTLTSNWIKVLFKDRQENLWVGTISGLNVLDKNTNKISPLVKSQENGLQSNVITALAESSDGFIWVGTTYGGLHKYDVKTKKFKAYTIAHGLPSNNIMSILEDNDQQLWISTDKGISCLELKTDKVRNYDVGDGLAGNVFNYNSSYKTASGELLFGSLNGLVSFYPEQIQKNDFSSRVRFTGLKLFNRKTKDQNDLDSHNQNISLQKEIRLNYDQNTFTLEFSSLNFIKSKKNKYAYKFDDLYSDWSYTNTPSVTLTNLPPGQYKLMVKSANSDGIWNNEPSSIKIDIAPPLWKTWWAYMLYVIAFASLAFVLIRSYMLRSRLKRELYFEQLENERQQAHQKLQMDFFTNISHELRTPLTLITAPLESAVETLSTQSPLHMQLTVVKKNADLMVTLVNELMDFRKIEAGQMKLQKNWHHFPSFLRHIYDLFSLEAINRNIRFELVDDSSIKQHLFDKNQLEKVFFNLLSNAFKFTPNHGKIKIIISQKAEDTIVQILDSGEGIPEESLDNIFTNYYQAESHGYRKNSSGIGLALAKAIISLHDGNITAKSNVDGWEAYHTIFTVSLPLPAETQQIIDPHAELLQSLLQAEPETAGYEPVLKSIDQPANKLTVLLVEDNEKVRELIKNVISPYYQVTEARNGEEGFEICCKAIPDLVISDAMMPVMDGFELCKKIKESEETAHIPVILLTARTEETDKMLGLETGANVYLTKPFNIKQLLLNMNNLMATREALKQRFSKRMLLQPEEVALTTGDEKFIQKLISIIEKNMESSEFGVAMLIDEIGMSKNVLYRKVNALTNLSIGDLIKSIRLKKAANLLLKKQHSVEEIAFTVGFTDAKYFGKEFKKFFGKSPSKFRNDDQIESGESVQKI